MWVKSNPKPESIKNRFGNCYEYIFFFTKDRSDYYFDMNSIREEYVGGNNGKILSKFVSIQNQIDKIKNIFI